MHKQINSNLSSGMHEESTDHLTSSVLLYLLIVLVSMCHKLSAVPPLTSACMCWGTYQLLQ